MHIGTWESKNNHPVGRSEKIPTSAEANYQKGEKSVGLGGLGVQLLDPTGEFDYLLHADGRNNQQLWESFNRLVLGLDPVTIQCEIEKRDLVKKMDDPETEQAARVELQEVLKNAQMRQHESNERTRTAIDVSWSPPKSFSIVHAMAEDDQLKQQMEDAFVASVQETMAEMETLAARRVRNYKKTDTGEFELDEYGKKIQADNDKTTGNLIYGQFVHYTNRPTEMAYDPETFERLQAEGIDVVHEGDRIIVMDKSIDGQDSERKGFVRDMQLHMHTPICNLTYDKEDKKWYALQKGGIMKKLPYFQALASQKLAAKMEDLGFPIERTGKRWEIRLLDDQHGRGVIEQFSKPTANVMQYARDYNLNKPEDRIKINQTIRQNKEAGVNDPDTLQKIWRAQLSNEQKDTLAEIYRDREINYENKDTLGYDYLGSTKHHRETAEDCIDHVLDAKTYRSAILDPDDVVTDAIHHGVSKSPEEIKAAFDAKVTDGKLFTRELENGSLVCTSREMIEEEQTLIKLATEGKGKHETLNTLLRKKGKLPDGYEPSKFAGGDYTTSQKQALASVLSSSDRVMFIEGDAGTGKTTVGLQIKRAVEMADRRLISTTVATSAKDVLEEDGYGKILLTDKQGVMVTEWDEAAQKERPRMVNRTEALAYYTEEYGSRENIPTAIANTLKRGKTEAPQTLSKLLMGYERYHNNHNHADEDIRKKAAAFKRKMQGQVLFIDEAGQLGSTQAVEVMKMAEEFNMRVILVGDRKQHRSVTRGNILDTLTRYAGLTPFAITDIRRQKGELKEVCQHMAKREYTTAFAMLKNMGGLCEVRSDEDVEATKGKIPANDHNTVEDTGELKEKFADEIIERMQKGEDPTIVIPDHDTGQQIDEMLREKLQALPQFTTGPRRGQKPLDLSKETTFTTLRHLHGFDSDSGKIKYDASQYQVGQRIQFIQNLPTDVTVSRTAEGDTSKPENKAANKGMIGRGDVGEILHIDKAKNQLTIRCRDKDGNEPIRIIDLNKGAEKNIARHLSIYEAIPQDIAPGDRIVVKKNFMVGAKNNQQISNGKSYNVKDIRQQDGHNVIILDSGDGNEIALNPETNVTHCNFSRQFYMTSYGAQGSTADKGACMVFHTPGKTGNLYVDLTRAAGGGEIGLKGKNQNLRVYTPSIKDLLADAQRYSCETMSSLDVLYSLNSTGLNLHNFEQRKEELMDELATRSLVDLRKLRTLTRKEMQKMSDFLSAAASNKPPGAEQASYGEMAEHVSAETARNMRTLWKHQAKALSALQEFDNLITARIEVREGQMRTMEETQHSEDKEQELATIR